MLKLLQNHTSQETAYIVENYPYGSLRTQMRMWVERATKGKGKGQDRPVTQTLNPKNNSWNKPHPGIYCDRIYLYLDTRNNHVKFAHLSINGPDSLIRFIATGLFNQLNTEQKEDVYQLCNLDKKYNAKSWNRYEQMYQDLIKLNEEQLNNPNLYDQFKNTDTYESDFKLILTQVMFDLFGKETLPPIE